MTIYQDSATFNGNIYAKNLDNGGFTDRVVSDKFQIDSISSSNAGSIFASGSINNTKITANSITADQLAANSITADKIINSTITGSNLKANIITDSKIIDSTIIDSNFAANSITAVKIQSHSIKANEIATSTLESLVTKTISETVDTYSTTAFSLGGVLRVSGTVKTARLNFTGTRHINGRNITNSTIPDKNGKQIKVTLWW